MYLKFVGAPGEFLTGVPGRDLSKADQEALDADARASLDAHLKTARPIYEKVTGDAPEGSPAYEAAPAPRKSVTVQAKADEDKT